MTDDRAPAGLTDWDENERMLAAEHALGVTEGTDRARAERLVAHDPAFAAEVAEWHDRLAPMLDEVEEATPPMRVWRAVEDEIGRADAPARRVVPDPVVVAREAGAIAVAPWRAFVLMVLGGALASFVLVTLGDGRFLRIGSPSAPVLVATLTGDGAPAAGLARLDGAGGLTLRVAAAGDDPATVPELWLIPADGVPRSLGLPGEGGRLALPANLAPAPGETLAVSLEPPGGSPTGAPTGPIVGSGALIEL